MNKPEDDFTSNIDIVNADDRLQSRILLGRHVGSMWSVYHFVKWSPWIAAVTTWIALCIPMGLIMLWISTTQGKDIEVPTAYSLGQVLMAYWAYQKAKHIPQETKQTLEEANDGLEEIGQKGFDYQGSSKSSDE